MPVGVEGLEEPRPAALDLVLRQARAQRLGETVPRTGRAGGSPSRACRRCTTASCDRGTGPFRGCWRSDRRSRVQEAERDQRVEEVARRSRMEPETAATAASNASGPCASSVKTPISMALSSVFEAQKARPVCRIFSGFGGCMDGVRCALRWQENARISACGSQEVKLDLDCRGFAPGHRGS